MTNKPILTKLDKRHYVTRSNTLISAHHKLSLLELKVVYAIISVINITDTDIKPCKMNVSSLAEFCNIGATDYWTTIKDITKSLLSKVLVINLDKDRVLQTHFVQSAEYISKDGTVEFMLDKKLKPYVIELKNQFTSIKVSELMSFRSIYAARLYELLYSYKKIGKREFTIEEFKESLDIRGKSYESFGNINKRVITPSIEEINRSTPCTITVKFIKMGRSVNSISFTIKEKDEEEKNTSEYNNTKEIVYKSLAKVGLEEYSEEYLRLYSVERIIKNVDKTIKNKKVENKTAYATTAIKKDFAQVDAIRLFEDKSKEEELQRKKQMIELVEATKKLQEDIIDNQEIIDVDNIQDPKLKAIAKKHFKKI